jgi:hypothetical protein
MSEECVTGDAECLAALIVSFSSGNGDHWSRTAQTLLAGMLSYWLHVLPVEFKRMASELADPTFPVERYWDRMHTRCPMIVASASYMRSVQEPERSAVTAIAYKALASALSLRPETTER